MSPCSLRLAICRQHAWQLQESRASINQKKDLEKLASIWQAFSHQRHDMIDCHSHVALSDFDRDRDDVIGRAREAGVESIVVVGQDIGDDHRVLSVCRQYPDILRPCIGLHPDQFSERQRAPNTEDIDAVIDLAQRQQAAIAGIGEVGLDYWSVKDPERRASQRRLLSRMVELSLELDLMLNIHSRSAGHYTLDLLAAHGAKRVLMHAFDGKARYATEAALAHGWCFAIPPSIVRSSQKQKLARALPLGSIALESDSPALGPDRNERNEPANVARSAKMIAELKNVDVETVKQITTENAKRLFGFS